MSEENAATARNSSKALNSSENNLAQKSYETIDWWNPLGGITLGGIHKEGDVKYGVNIETADGEHGFCLDSEGPRKGWTSSIQPGHFQLECGSSSTQAEDSLMINAKNGNVVINAGNGNLRFEADNIEFVSRGTGTSNGNFVVHATEKVMFHSKEFSVNATSSFKLLTPNKGEIIANGVLKIYSSIIRGVTDASKNKDSKLGTKKYCAEQNQV